MSWLYHQASGCTDEPSGKILCSGYSGQPPYVNNPGAEKLEGKGPIPCGNWKMISLEAETPLHGPDVIVLQPDADTRARIIAMGRDPDSFRVHGERLTPPPGLASDGCIINGHPYRMIMWNSPDHDLEVIA